jgi:hypothetical protein
MAPGSTVRGGDISGMEECKIPVERQNVKEAPTGGFYVPRTAIFPSRASF